MKTRLTLILVLLIYIGAASHTHAQQKKVIKTKNNMRSNRIYRCFNRKS